MEIGLKSVEKRLKLPEVLPVELAVVSRIEKSGSADKIRVVFGVGWISQLNRIVNMSEVLRKNGLLPEHSKGHFWQAFAEGYLANRASFKDTSTLLQRNKRINSVLDLYYPREGTSIFNIVVQTAALRGLFLGLEMGGVRATADLIEDVSARTRMPASVIGDLINPEGIIGKVDSDLDDIHGVGINLGDISQSMETSRHESPYHNSAITLKPTFNAPPLAALELFRPASHNR